MAATVARKRIASRGDLVEVIHEAATLLREHGISALYLGSFEDTDHVVELTVDYASDYPFTLLTLVRLEKQLSELVGRRVELTTFDAIGPTARERVLSDGMRIF